MTVFQQPSNGLGKGLGLVVSDCGIQGHVYLEPFGARRLWKRLHPETGKDLSYPESHLTAVNDVGRGARIEIESDHRWPLHIGSLRKRGVQLQVSKISQPYECWKIRNDAVIHVTIVAFAPDLRRLHPLGAEGRAILFVKMHALNAIRITLQGKGPAREMGQEHRRDPDVIINDLSFGEARFRVE